MTKVCPLCGKKYPDNTKFCPLLHCPNCGSTDVVTIGEKHKNMMVALEILCLTVAALSTYYYLPWPPVFQILAFALINVIIGATFVFISEYCGECLFCGYKFFFGKKKIPLIYELEPVTKKY